MTAYADTIFAIATAPGRAGVAVLRISGTGSGTALAAFGTALPQPRMATLCTLTHKSEIIDEALVLWFPAPKSFTGEDVIELHIHGSRAVMQEIIEILTALPHTRPAEPGEFTRRAFLNGKMDLTEAEALADLVEAETRAQKNQAIRQMQGELGALYEGFRAQIIKSLAHLEAYIDFPDEEIPESVTAEINRDMAALQQNIHRHLSDNRKGEKLREGLYAVIIGPPNAGKSSLMNWLAGRDVAIVSQHAGTTRDVIEVHLELGGYPLILADTAGLRASGDAIEEEGVRRALVRAEQADIKIALFDATALPTLDKPTLALVDENTLVLMNKQDAAKGPLPASVNNQLALPISVKNETGLEKALAALTHRLSETFTPSSSAVITRARHRVGLEEAQRHLQQFASGTLLELRCEELRLAAKAIGSITGKIDVEDILDVIFSSFCIGK